MWMPMTHLPQSARYTMSAGSCAVSQSSMRRTMLTGALAWTTASSQYSLPLTLVQVASNAGGCVPRPTRCPPALRVRAAPRGRGNRGRLRPGAGDDRGVLARGGDPLPAAAEVRRAAGGGRAHLHDGPLDEVVRGRPGGRRPRLLRHGLPRAAVEPDVHGGDRGSVAGAVGLDRKS